VIPIIAVRAVSRREWIRVQGDKELLTAKDAKKSRKGHEGRTKRGYPKFVGFYVEKQVLNLFAFFATFLSILCD
jgi:hypothetical protein